MKFNLKFDAGTATDKKHGYFAGIASTPKMDSYRDVIAAGAFDESIATRGMSGPKAVKMLFQHDTALPIGNWVKMETQGQSLYVEGQLNKSLPTYETYRTLVKDDLIGSISVGFKIQVRSYDQENDIRTITKGDLREASIVTFPANEDAIIFGMKSDDLDEDEPMTLSELEKSIASEFNLSRRQAALIVQATKNSKLFGGPTVVPVVTKVEKTVQETDYNGALALIESIRADRLVAEAARLINSMISR